MSSRELSVTGKCTCNNLLLNRKQPDEIVPNRNQPEQIKNGNNQSKSIIYQLT